MRAVPRVAGKVDRFGRAVQNETAPQRAVAIERRPSGEMLRRHAADATSSSKIRFLPPIELDDVLQRQRAQAGAKTEHGHTLRVRAVRAPAERRRLQVIVMIVADQNDVGQREIVERNGGRPYPARPDTAEGPRMRGEYRVGQDHRVGRADQERRVADESDRHAAAINRRGGRRIAREWHLLGPWRLVARALPGDHVGDRSVVVSVGIEEPFAVAMIGDRKGRSWNLYTSAVSSAASLLL